MFPLGRFLCVAAVCALCASQAGARPVKIWTPEELAAAAEVIANGRVERVKITDEEGELVLGQNQPVPVRTAEAVVRRLGVEKGSMAPEFRLRFVVLDGRRLPAIVNGPMLTGVEAGKRYRFYLRKEGGAYVGVLGGDFDDGWAVIPLADGEADDSPALTKAEAVELARAYYAKLRPDDRPVEILANYFGGTWSVQFFNGPPLEYPSYSYEAEIQVDGSRHLTPGSWVGRERPREGRELGPGDAGTPVRLVVEGDFREGKFVPAQGLMTALFGTIDKVGGTITGSFFQRTADKPGELRFPRDAVRSVQRIFPAGKN